MPFGSILVHCGTPSNPSKNKCHDFHTFATWVWTYCVSRLGHPQDRTGKTVLLTRRIHLQCTKPSGKIKWSKRYEGHHDSVPLGPLGPLGPLVLLVLPPVTAMAANQQPGEIKGRKELLFHRRLNVFFLSTPANPYWSTH